MATKKAVPKKKAAPKKSTEIIHVEAHLGPVGALGKGEERKKNLAKLNESVRKVLEDNLPTLSGALQPQPVAALAVKHANVRLTTRKNGS